MEKTVVHGQQDSLDLALSLGLGIRWASVLCQVLQGIMGNLLLLSPGKPIAGAGWH